MTTNPAKLPFPVDKYGFTSPIKKEILKAAATINGNQEKHELLLNTLVVLITHVKLRQERDKTLQKQRREFAEAVRKERTPRERLGAGKPSKAARVTNDGQDTNKDE